MFDQERLSDDSNLPGEHGASPNVGEDVNRNADSQPAVKLGIGLRPDGKAGDEPAGWVDPLHTAVELDRQLAAKGQDAARFVPPFLLQVVL